MSISPIRWQRQQTDKAEKGSNLYFQQLTGTPRQDIGFATVWPYVLLPVALEIVISKDLTPIIF
jgi:hypothetical protein